MPLRTGKLLGFEDIMGAPEMQPSEMNIRVVPTTPQDGDIWMESTNEYFRLYERWNGATRLLYEVNF